MRRTVPALIVIAALAGAALTGCSTSSEASACNVTSGSGSDSITASGKFGQDPKAKVPSPLNVSRVESSTLIKGTGPQVNKGGAAQLAITVFDGETGAGGQTQSGFFPVVGSQISTGLADALACTTEGSRIAVVLPPKDATTLGAQGGSAVAIVDVEKALPNRATGRSRAATPGFPTVILAPNGQPGIVIGDHAEPKKVSAAILKEGEGAKAKKSDTLIVQTQTVSWADPTSASGSWEQGSPATQTLNDGSALSSELIGKRVGSQVIVQVPASKSSDGNASATVVDILGVLPASASSAQ